MLNMYVIFNVSDYISLISFFFIFSLPFVNHVLNNNDYFNSLNIYRNVSTFKLLRKTTTFVFFLICHVIFIFNIKKPHESLTIKHGR